MSREGQAGVEAMEVFEDPAPSEAAVGMALEVAEKLCDDLENRLRDQEIRQMLDTIGVFIERSALLLGHSARLAAVEGDTTTARRLLKKARRIEPDLPIYHRADQAMKPHKQSWWRW